MAYDITLIPGDGIGPEITDATLKVLDATGIRFTWDRQLGGAAAVAASGDPLPEPTLASIRRTRLALKGPLTTPVGGGYRSVNVALRKEFELYANVRPAKTIVPGGRYDGIDIVLVRENLEGLYVGQERWVERDGDPHGQAESVAVVTRRGSERVIRYAFDYALKHSRKQVTVVHKANILKHTSGLFLDVAREIATEHAGRVAMNELIVDNCAMQLVMRPEQFDVIVTTNLFGDILSDEISGLVGGLGLAPGGNIGEHGAIFEAVHGSAPDIAGKGIANPSALILAAAMMLDHVGEAVAGDRVRRAIVATIVADRVRTGDLGGTATTEEFGDAVARRVA
jgi:isocitrate dehydrogenase (NAD+)